MTVVGVTCVNVTGPEEDQATPWPLTSLATVAITYRDWPTFMATRLTGASDTLGGAGGKPELPL